MHTHHGHSIKKDIKKKVGRKNGRKEKNKWRKESKEIKEESKTFLIEALIQSLTLMYNSYCKDKEQGPRYMRTCLQSPSRFEFEFSLIMSGLVTRVSWRKNGKG